ncbi:MAG TPA: hypothetical protein VMS17_07470 [Gemmataceae bacterium]|nr:hypothetical protein [Gemmataceae bacterium]
MAENVVIGPMLTASGFRSWYWACRATHLVAVPAGFWAAVAAAMPGAYGGLAEMPGRVKGNKLTTRLAAASEEELAATAGAVVYQTADLASIACKRVVFGTNPDFIVSTKAGRSQKYGLAHPLNFDAVVNALRECCGDLVQQP